MIRIALLVIGLLCLANPVIRVVDVVPDAIGCFLICLALLKPSCYTGRLEKAKNQFFRLGLVECAKLLAIVIQVKATDTTTPLLLATVFGIIEIIMFIPAAVNLFDGIPDCTNGHFSPAGKRSVKADSFARVKVYVIIFYIVRVVMTVLPELTELEMFEHYGSVVEGARSLSSFKPLLYLLTVSVVVVMALVYIVLILVLFIRLKRDKVFAKTLEDRYTDEILPKKTYLVSKRMNVAMILMIAAAVSSTTLIFDNINVTVSALAAMFVIGSAAAASKYNRKILAVAPAALASGVLSVFGLIRMIRFYDDYGFSFIGRNETATAVYYFNVGIVTAEKALMLLVFLMMTVFLYRMVSGHIKKFLYATDRVAVIDKERRHREEMQFVRPRFIIFGILTVVKFLSDIIYYYVVTTFDMAVFVCIAISVIYAVYSIYALYSVNDRVYINEIRMS
jgi:hypothetical protein